MRFSPPSSSMANCLWSNHEGIVPSSFSNAADNCCGMHRRRRQGSEHARRTTFLTPSAISAKDDLFVFLSPSWPWRIERYSSLSRRSVSCFKRFLLSWARKLSIFTGLLDFFKMDVHRFQLQIRIIEVFEHLDLTLLVDLRQLYTQP